MSNNHSSDALVSGTAAPAGKFATPDTSPTSAASAASPTSAASSAPTTSASSPTPAPPAAPAASTRVKATLQMFLGGASYGVMATVYKLTYAAGFSPAHVTAGQAWAGFALFACLLALGIARGRSWQRLGARQVAKLVGVGMCSGVTCILYTYAMSLLPVPVALALLFQFTWIGSVIEVAFTRKPPAPMQVVAALVVIGGTVLASNVWQTGILEYNPTGIACALGAAVSCALFVTMNGRVRTTCSTAQRGLIVAAGMVITSHLVCPDFVISGVLLEGMAPYALVAGFFSVVLPVVMFGLGAPHLTPGVSTILTSAELPAGLFTAMLVLGTPVSPLEWLGVAIILAGVCIAQTRLPLRQARA